MEQAALAFGLAAAEAICVIVISAYLMAANRDVQWIGMRTAVVAWCLSLMAGVVHLGKLTGIAARSTELTPAGIYSDTTFAVVQHATFFVSFVFYSFAVNIGRRLGK